MPGPQPRRAVEHRLASSVLRRTNAPSGVPGVYAVRRTITPADVPLGGYYFHTFYGTAKVSAAGAVLWATELVDNAEANAQGGTTRLVVVGGTLFAASSGDAAVVRFNTASGARLDDPVQGGDFWYTSTFSDALSHNAATTFPDTPGPVGDISSVQARSNGNLLVGFRELGDPWTDDDAWLWEISGTSGAVVTQFALDTTGLFPQLTAHEPGSGYAWSISPGIGIVGRIDLSLTSSNPLETVSLQAESAARGLPSYSVEAQDIAAGGSIVAVLTKNFATSTTDITTAPAYLWVLDGTAGTVVDVFGPVVTDDARTILDGWVHTDGAFVWISAFTLVTSYTQCVWKVNASSGAGVSAQVLTLPNTYDFYDIYVA